MTRSARARVVAHALAGGLLAGPALLALPGSAVAAESLSYVTMNYASAGKLWRTGTASITTNGTASTTAHVSMYDNSGGAYGSFWFRPPEGQALAPGTYENVGNGTAGTPQAGYAIGSSACGSVSGGFTVHEIAEDLSRLRLSYDLWCDGDPGIFGEVDLGATPDGTQPMLLPAAVTWPAQYPKTASPTVGVTLLNTTAAPVVVGGAAITAGGTDFSVKSSTCGTVAVGATCTVHIGFKPTGTGPRTGELTITDGSGPRVVTLSGSGDLGHTSWRSYMPGTAGDDPLVVNHAYTPATADITVRGDATRLSVAIHHQYDSSVFLRLRAASGDTMRAGTAYAGAGNEIWGESAVPGIDLSMSSTSCGTQSGGFTVHDIGFHPDGRLTKLSATFTHLCNGDYTTVGSVAWHSPDPAEPLPGIAGVGPEPVQRLTAASGWDTTTLSWANPRTPDFRSVVVVRKSGAVAPTSPTDGTTVYSGTGSTKKVTGLQAGGKSYAFSVFARDSEGLYSKRTALVVSGSAVTTTASTRDVRYFDEVTFRGRLTSTRTANPLTGRTVGLWARRPGSTEWLKLTTARTDSTGRYKLSFAPGIALDYWVFFDGAQRALGSGAGPVRVRVRAGAEIAVDRSSGRLGTTFTVGTVVGPPAPGKPVRLQRLVNGTWTTIDTKTLKKSDPTFFEVRPTRRGTFKYRVVKPASTARARAVSDVVTIKVT